MTNETHGTGAVSMAAPQNLQSDGGTSPGHSPAADARDSVVADPSIEQSTDLHARMVEWFGLPTPHEGDHEQLFGWYHMDGDTRYWVYDPQDDAFRILTSDHQWIRPKLSGEWEEGDLEQIRQLMDGLQFLPRPPLPADPTVAARGDSFAYEGWLFSWFFFPELRRWELGVVERLWYVEADQASTENDDLSWRDRQEQRRERTLSIATQSMNNGARLFDRYRKAMVLLGTWNAPDPHDGFNLIPGAALEASSHLHEPTDVIRAVSRATGCDEALVQSVIDYLEATNIYKGKWFRAASANIVFPELY